MSPVHSYTRSSFLDLVISRVRAFARIRKLGPAPTPPSKAAPAKAAAKTKKSARKPAKKAKKSKRR